MKSKQDTIVFVAHSFAAEDVALTSEIFKTLKRAKLRIVTGERFEARGVSEKIKAQIKTADLFIGILTRRHQVGSGNVWTTSPWIVEEKGYSLGENPQRPIILLVEEGIPIPEETGGLVGDLEYMIFNRYELDVTQQRLFDLLSKVR